MVTAMVGVLVSETLHLQSAGKLVRHVGIVNPELCSSVVTE